MKKKISSLLFLLQKPIPSLLVYFFPKRKDFLEIVGEKINLENETFLT